MQTVLILGRQPAIGLAELESLYGTDHVRSVGVYASVVDIEVDFGRLGGSLKTAQLLHVLDTTNWKEIQNHLEKHIPDNLKKLPEGKLSFGMSAYGFDISPQRITATGLNLKKVIRALSRPVRLVPNNESALSSAQVLHNKLTTQFGWELLIIRDGNKTILARTSAVQDIDAYTLRDRGRPWRDARVGMLPPKLAQIIVNLASPLTSRSASSSKVTSDDHVVTLLDPFCGTGVILQEALLMGYDVAGSDLEPRMIEYSEKNLQWLQEKVSHKAQVLKLEPGDATNHVWTTPFIMVASEVYLGRPFTSLPSLDMLEKNRQDCDTIIKKFLKNMAAQTKPGTRMCLAVPAWFVGGEVYRLRTLAIVENLGYNHIDFVRASHKDLIYHRESQIVGRELVVLIRK